jgi:hypothetical protein
VGDASTGLPGDFAGDVPRAVAQPGQFPHAALELLRPAFPVSRPRIAFTRPSATALETLAPLPRYDRTSAGVASGCR